MATINQPFYDSPIWIRNDDQVDPFPWITLSTDQDLGLATQTITSTEGIIAYQEAYSLTAQTVSGAEGIIGSEADYALTAITATFTEGTLTDTGSSVPTGQTATFTEGVISATGGDLPVVAKPGGSGKRRRIKRAAEVFEEEMARLEESLAEATAQRIEVEEQLSATPQYGPTPAEVLRYIANFERALRRAQEREKQQAIEVPVYFRLPQKSAGVRRVEAHQRLQSLAKVARYREQVAQERLRKVRERIDLEAATYLMEFLMWDD